MADQPVKPAPFDALLFVYNADSGLFNTLADIAHKAFSPHTYACQLCALTHGHFHMSKAWKAFIANLPVSCEFLHRDEFEKCYGPSGQRLPVVYRRQGRQLTLHVSAAEIEACSSIEELKQAIGKSISVLQSSTPTAKH